MKVFIKTYGCQANISDSEQMAGILKEAGHQIVGDENEAETILVNTCSVKNKTQSKILHYINEHKDREVVVGGCLTKTLDLRKRFPDLKAVFDTNSVSKISEIIKGNDVFSEEKEHRIDVPVFRSNNEIAIISTWERVYISSLL